MPFWFVYYRLLRSMPVKVSARQRLELQEIITELRRLATLEWPGVSELEMEALPAA